MNIFAATEPWLTYGFLAIIGVLLIYGFHQVWYPIIYQLVHGENYFDKKEEVA